MISHESNASNRHDHQQLTQRVELWCDNLGSSFGKHQTPASEYDALSTRNTSTIWFRAS